MTVIVGKKKNSTKASHSRVILLQTLVLVSENS